MNIYVIYYYTVIVYNIFFILFVEYKYIFCFEHKNETMTVPLTNESILQVTCNNF